MPSSESPLTITLDDGRSIIAIPAPEDQERLAEFVNRTVTIEALDTDFDTSGHSDIASLMVDVEGHAMTLRLPNQGDADALRKALAVGAVTATLVVAGGIAALQGSQPMPAAPAHPLTVDQPLSIPAPAPGFQVRREQQINEMLEAPAPLAQPGDVTTERLDRTSISPSTGAAGAAGAAAAGAAAGSQSAGSFEDRREQKADKLLEAPEPLPEPGDMQIN